MEGYTNQLPYQVNYTSNHTSFSPKYTAMVVGLPSGNQPWPWKILYCKVTFLLKPPFLDIPSGFPIAMFDYQMVPHIFGWPVSPHLKKN